MRAPRTALVTCLVCLLLAPQAVATTVDFESPALADGTTVSSQFAAAKGVTFVSGAPTGAPTLPLMRVASGEARGGTHALNVSTDAQEFPHPDFAGAFSTTRTTVSLYAKTLDASITLRLDAYDSGGGVIASSTNHTLTTAGGYVLFTATAPSAAIAYFRLHRPSGVLSAGVRVDDLSYDDPVVVQPDFALQTPTTYLSVPAGSTTQVPITINRINGSNGAILLSDSSSSIGVTFTPNPVPATATSVTADITFPNTNAPFNLTITGTPQVAGAGASARTLDLGGLMNLPADIVATPGTGAVDLPPCSSAQSRMTVVRAAGLTSPIHVGVPGSTPAGVTVGIDPDTLTGFASQTTATLTRGDDLQAPADGHLQVISTAEGYGLQDVLPFTAHLLPTSIASAAGASAGANRGRTPQAMAAGDLVTLTGAGFCPGSTVRFGNAAAQVPLTVSSDGTTAAATVPALATDGPLTVVSPAGRETQTSSSFDVQSYRDTNGFRFPNEPYRGDINSWFALYGLEQFFIQVDACAVLTFGAAHCPVPSPIPNPLSYLVFGIGDPALAGAGGSCFGFALASRRMVAGRGPVPALFRGGSTVWSIPHGDQVMRYIWSQHVAQLSAEVLAQAWRQRIGGSLSFRSAGELRSRVESAIRTGGKPLISLAYFTRGHAIVAYDVVNGPGAGFTIRVYNNNEPYRTDEASADGAAARAAETNSEIVVDAAGNWTFPELGWNGGLGDIVVINDRTLPDKPTLPSSPEGIITMIFGAGAPAPGAVGSRAAAAGSGLLRFPIPDDRTPAPVLIGDVKRAHPLRVTPGKGGRLDALVAGGGHSARVTAAGVGGPSTLTGGAGGTSAGLSFGRARSLKLTLAGGRATGASHSMAATLSGSLARGDTLVSRGRGYRLDHRGAAATLRLSLTSAGSGMPSAFAGAPLRLVGAGTVSVSPDWRHLDRALRVVVKDARGTRVLRLVNRARPSVRVSSVRVKATRRGRSVTAVVSSRLSGQAASRAAGAIAVVVRRGSRVIARKGLAAKGKALRRTTLKLTLPKSAKGPFSVRALVTSIGAGTAQSPPSTARGTTRLR